MMLTRPPLLRQVASQPGKPHNSPCGPFWAAPGAVGVAEGRSTVAAAKDDPVAPGGAGNGASGSAKLGRGGGKGKLSIGKLGEAPKLGERPPSAHLAHDPG
jgi:hypothetical protein